MKIPLSDYLSTKDLPTLISRRKLKNFSKILKTISIWDLFKICPVKKNDFYSYDLFFKIKLPCID